jgi:hypothetical protein
VSGEWRFNSSHRHLILRHFRFTLSFHFSRRFFFKSKIGKLLSWRCP